MENDRTLEAREMENILLEGKTAFIQERYNDTIGLLGKYYKLRRVYVKHYKDDVALRFHDTLAEELEGYLGGVGICR